MKATVSDTGIDLKKEDLYVDYSKSYDECRQCLAEFEDKRSPLYEFCKDFMEKWKGGVEKSPEKAEPEQIPEEEKEGEEEVADVEKEEKVEKNGPGEFFTEMVRVEMK